MSDIPSGFQALGERVTRFHSYIIALFSGVVIGFLTNYLISYVFPLPFVYGLGLGLSLLVFSIYLFLLYSPEAVLGYGEEIVPKSLHTFLHANFDKLLSYIKADMEGFAFHKKSVSATGWTAPISGVRAKTTQISSHQGEIELMYPFLWILECKITLRIFVTLSPKDIKEYRKVVVSTELNKLARLHPKSDMVLRTIGIRLRHAIFNPQVVYPDISDEEYEKILKEIRPSVWEAYRKP